MTHADENANDGDDKKLIANGALDQDNGYLHDSPLKRQEISDVDTILSLIGEFSKFQIRLTVLLCVLMFATVPHTLAIVFYVLEPPWKCTNVSIGECATNGTFNTKHSYYKERCHMNRSSWTYATNKGFSAVSEFDIICDKQWLILITTSVGFLGAIIGTVAIGVASDRFGRRLTLITSFTLIQSIAFGTSFAPNFALYTFGLFFGGFFLTGVVNVLYVYQVELVGPTKRAVASMILWLFFSLALAILSLVAYYVRGWRTLSRIISAPYLILVPITWKIVPESVRWLLVNGKPNEAEIILRKIAKTNGKAYPNVKLQQIKETKATFKDLFYGKEQMMLILVHGCVWCIHSIIYYGASLSVSLLGEQVHLIFGVMSLIEIPATLMSMYLCDRFGRRATTLWNNFITVAIMIAISCLPDDPSNTSALSITKVTLGILSKFFISAAFNAVYLLTSESFPTVLRSRGIHTMEVILLIGGTLAPWLTMGTNMIHKRATYPILTVLLIIAGLVAFKLDETKGKETQETIGDRTNSVTKMSQLVDNVSFGSHASLDKLVVTPEVDCVTPI